MSNRLLALGLGVLLTAAACTGDRAQSSTTPPPTTEPLPTATTTTVPEDVADESTTTTTKAIVLEWPDAPVESVVARESGLWLLLRSGAEVQVWDFPTAVGLALGDEIVVAQAASTPNDVYPPLRDGPVLVLSRDGLGRIDPPDGYSEIELHDAGFLEGRAVILVTVASRSDPETAEERLLLWDLEREEWADLGISGGWESGVGQARLADSGVVASLFGEGEGSGWVEHRARDGSVTWRTEPGTGDETIAFSQETGEILVLGAGFTDDAFLPVLRVRGYAEEDGSETRQAVLELILPDDISIQGGFCSTAELIGPEVLCDQTYGGPLLIALESAHIRRYGDFEEGVVTLVRHPVCQPAPFQVTILPWVERSEPLPEPEVQVKVEEGRSSLFWEGPPGTSHEGGNGYVVLERYPVPDSPLGGPGHPVDIPVRGTFGEIVWVGDPGVGEVRLNWLEHDGNCGYYALHLLDITLTEQESEQYLREAAASLTEP